MCARVCIHFSRTGQRSILSNFLSCYVTYTFFIIYTHVCLSVCVQVIFVQAHAMVYMWRSNDNFRCQGERVCRPKNRSTKRANGLNDWVIQKREAGGREASGLEKFIVRGRNEKSREVLQVQETRVCFGRLRGTTKLSRVSLRPDKETGRSR